MPIVGTGSAYQKLPVPIIGPTQQLPSSGFNYIMFGRLLNPLTWRQDMNPLNLVKDLGAGLLLLTWQQLRAVQRYGQTCDLLFATGDVVPILFAYLTGKPFMAFLVSTSGYYEGQTRLPLLAWRGLQSPRCRAVFTPRCLHRRRFAPSGADQSPILRLSDYGCADAHGETAAPAARSAHGGPTAR
jgi:uncharacterized protein (TIGR03492 family)